MIVVDANVLVYWVARGPLTTKVDELVARDPNWRSPPLWRFEFTNAIVMMLRARMLDEARAVECLAKAGGMMAARETTVPQLDAFRAALRYDLSAYDAQYVALAEISGVKCVTNDGPLLRKTPGITVPLAEFDKYL